MDHSSDKPLPLTRIRDGSPWQRAAKRMAGAVERLKKPHPADAELTPSYNTVKGDIIAMPAKAVTAN